MPTILKMRIVGDPGPERLDAVATPERTEKMNEEMLASLVTQESLIGVGDPLKAEVVHSK